VMKGAVIATIPYENGNAYILSKAYRTAPRKPYSEELVKNGFNEVVLLNEYYNPVTNERVHIWHTTAKGGAVVVFISEDTKVSQREIDRVKYIADGGSWKKQSPVVISNLKGKIDYVGGCTFTFDIQNQSDKTIKYVSVYWYCLNAVGDKLYDVISWEDRFSGRITGPIEPGQKLTGLQNFRPFYNPDVVECSLIEYVIDYMDGSVEIVTPDVYCDYFRGY